MIEYIRVKNIRPVTVYVEDTTRPYLPIYLAPGEVKILRFHLMDPSAVRKLECLHDQYKKCVLELTQPIRKPDPESAKYPTLSQEIAAILHKDLE